MKLTYAEYAKSKDATCLGRWCLLVGREQHLKDEMLSRLRGEARKAGGDEPSWESLDGGSVTAREVLNRCQTASLFGGARVVVVREVGRMASEEQESLAKAVRGLPEGVTVALVTGVERDRRRSGVGAALRRAVEKEGVVVEFPALKVGEAAAWAIARAKKLGKKLEPAAARKLADQKVGTDLGELAREIEKLALFVGDLGIIAGSHVDEVTPRLIEEDVFRLVDAVGRRQVGRAVGILRELLVERRDAPERILAMLARSVRLIWQTKVLVERGWRPKQEVDEETAALLPQDDRRNALAEFARRPWLAQRTVRQANALSWSQLRRAVHALHACDLAMKGMGGRVTDSGMALELVVVELCTDVEMPVWGERSGR